MAMLHTVNKSPFERCTLKSCIDMAKSGSSILLIEDGVLAATQNTSVANDISKAMEGITFYILGPDFNARGLSEDKLIDGIKTVDYEGFVELVAQHDAVQSWL